MLQPLTSYVIIKRLDPATMSPGGIIIPQISQEKPAKGIVIAAGPGKMLPSGIIEPTGVVPGNVVYFGQWKGTEVEVNGERILIMKAEDLLAVEEMEIAA